jgi:hypothetical protein
MHVYKNLDHSIKCMSATPFQQRELTALGLNKKGYFSFHEVPDAFVLAECDSASATANEPGITHGVLIFDKHQNLRYRYLSDRPLSDLEEITYALMELNESASGPKAVFNACRSQKNGRELRLYHWIFHRGISLFCNEIARQSRCNR